MLALLSPFATRTRLSLALGVLAGSGMLLVIALRTGTPGYATASVSMRAAPALAAPAPTDTAPTAIGASATAAAVWPAAPAPAISVGQSWLGPVVVDGSGWALYRFDKDAPDTGMSACNGQCAVTWPPAVVAGEPTAAPGLAGTLGTIVRADGARQLTLDGHPLYRYAGGHGAGDVSGDGVGGIWHVVRPTATPAAAAAPAPSGY
jgi:predicted lipoprotein with Yx(FWY)xxD motif